MLTHTAADAVRGCTVTGKPYTIFGYGGKQVPEFRLEYGTQVALREIHDVNVEQ